VRGRTSGGPIRTACGCIAIRIPRIRRPYCVGCFVPPATPLPLHGGRPQGVGEQRLSAYRHGEALAVQSVQKHGRGRAEWIHPRHFFRRAKRPVTWTMSSLCSRAARTSGARSGDCISSADLTTSPDGQTPAVRELRGSDPQPTSPTTASRNETASPPDPVFAPDRTGAPRLAARRRRKRCSLRRMQSRRYPESVRRQSTPAVSGDDLLEAKPSRGALQEKEMDSDRPHGAARKRRRAR